ncbi:unnamed protein product [Schistosoma curassoni]|uniref:Uncharacterized protein n=1 Tax=Schistosoma curassoni TaxID=6186 RepID=A0A183K1I8_9TREM|nr:unnamed protein product [Schistosoma curassoni]
MESSSTRVSPYLGLVSWMCLHLTIDVHFGTRTQYRSNTIALCT